MIMHLSAPPDSSINDGIDKEEFTLRYATFDDAVQMINRLGSNSLLAKIEVPSHPTRQSRRQRAVGHMLEAKVVRGLLSPIWTSVRPVYIQPICTGIGMDSSSQLSHSKHYSLPGRFSDSEETFIC